MKRTILVFALLFTTLFLGGLSAKAQNGSIDRSDKTITLQEAFYALNNGRPSSPTPQIVKTLTEMGPLFNDPSSFSWVKYKGLFYALSSDLPIFVVFKSNGELVADLDLEPAE